MSNVTLFKQHETMIAQSDEESVKLGNINSKRRSR